MEEILASIKRVIAEDKENAASPARSRRIASTPSAEPPPAPPAPEEDVLELEDPVGDEDGLLSSDAAAISRERLAALSALRERAGTPSVAADPSPLEAVIRDMLRPMLKDWLDEHLPEIVEQLVTREIARITGRNI